MKSSACRGSLCSTLRIFISTVCLIGLISSAFAQTEKKPLTNADVLQMVKAGLAETVIISAIEGGLPRFDITPDTLIKLNQQGVSAKVQEAMLAAQKKSDAPANPGVVTTGAAQFPVYPNAPMPNTVAFLDGTNRVDLKQSQGRMESTHVVFYADLKTVFEGKAAQFRVATAMPIFEVTLLPNLDPSDWVILIKPKVKKDQREIFLGGAAPFAQIKPDKKKDTVPLMNEVARKENAPGLQLTTYRMKPANALPGGEYVLSVQGSYYCFGVDAAN